MAKKIMTKKKAKEWIGAVDKLIKSYKKESHVLIVGENAYRRLLMDKDKQEFLEAMAENYHTCEVCNATLSRDEVTIRAGDHRVMCDLCYEKNHCAMCGITIFLDESRKHGDGFIVCTKCWSAEINAGERWG